MLTKHQIQELDKCIADVVLKLNGIYHFNLKIPQYFFDIRGTTAGLAKSATMSIHFNQKLAELNWNEFIKTTVPHEICHIGVFQLVKEKIINRYPPAHGATWKLMMHQVGSNAKTTHNMDTSTVKQKRKKYIYSCMCNQEIIVDINVHKKILNGIDYKCRKCGTILKDGKMMLTKSFNRESPNGTTKVNKNENNN